MVMCGHKVCSICGVLDYYTLVMCAKRTSGQAKTVKHVCFLIIFCWRMSVDGQCVVGRLVCRLIHCIVARRLLDRLYK